jgi:hypothetical protein
LQSISSCHDCVASTACAYESVGARPALNIPSANAPIPA